MSTFRELYIEQKAKPSPSEQFVTEIARITCRERSTVLQWVSGVQFPNDICAKAISDYIGIPADELFPEIKNRKKPGPKPSKKSKKS